MKKVFISLSCLAAVLVFIGGAFALTCDPVHGIPGDCNGDGGVNAGDISALVLEIFDGDGDLPADAPGGTFPGDPIGSDANEDGVVNAGDISCTVLLIFNGQGACGASAAASSAMPAASVMLDSYQAESTGPGLEIPDLIAPNPDGTVSVPVNFTSHGNDISVTVFSVDYDESMLSFDPSDNNGDTIPDSITFNISPYVFSPGITFDAGDTDGELDFIVADNAPPLASLPEGILVEIRFTVLPHPLAQTMASVNFSESVFISYGDTLGLSIDGTSDNGSVLIPAGATCSQYTKERACKEVEYCTWNKKNRICEHK